MKYFEQKSFHEYFKHKQFQNLNKNSFQFQALCLTTMRHLMKLVKASELTTPAWNPEKEPKMFGKVH